MLDGIRHDFYLDGAKILREVWEDNVLIPLYDNEDSVCGIVHNDKPYYFVKNLQGDIIAITDMDGEVVARYTYDAWGKCENDPNFINHPIAEINPFRYRGYYYDRETKLYYLQSRYYDAEVGRFVNSDMVEFAVMQQGAVEHNLFAYCGNEPVGYVDEDGARRKPRVRHRAYVHKAIAYARKWWNSRNPEFSYATTDCANFVSQCLYAGGFLTNLTWYYLRTKIGGKWKKIKVSNAWGNANGLYSYMKKLYKNKKSITNCLELKTVNDLKDVIKKRKTSNGDVAFYLYKSSPKIARHAMFVGGLSPKQNNIFYWAHTNNRNGDNMKSGKGLKEILQDGNKNVVIFNINYMVGEWI